MKKPYVKPSKPARGKRKNRDRAEKATRWTIDGRPTRYARTKDGTKTVQEALRKRTTPARRKTDKREGATK